MTMTTAGILSLIYVLFILIIPSFWQCLKSSQKNHCKMSCSKCTHLFPPKSFNPLFSGCREQEPETKVKQQLWKLLPRKQAVLKTNNWQRRLQGSNQLFSYLPFLATRMLCIVSCLQQFNNLRSASDHNMDTSESKPGTSGGAPTASAAPQAASTEAFKESDVANIVSMGFAREVF